MVYLQVIFWQVLALLGDVDPLIHVTHHRDDRDVVILLEC